MPSGAEFATDIFLDQDRLDRIKSEFKEDLEVVMTHGHRNYLKWLGVDRKKPQVRALGNADLEEVIDSGLENNGGAILDLLQDFDARWAEQLTDQDGNELLSPVEAQRLADLGVHDPLVIPAVNDERVAGLFANEKFRSLLALTASEDFEWDTERYPVYLLVSTLIGVAAGAAMLGMAKVHADAALKNAPPLPGAPDEIQWEVVIPSLSVKSSSQLVGVWRKLIACDPASSGYAAVSAGIARRVMEMTVDYQVWISKLYHNLFRPADSFNKFSKAVMFMRAAGDLIDTEYETAQKSAARGYYEDIAENDLQPTAIATTNYTRLVSRTAVPEDALYFLNGRTGAQYDPYLQQNVQNDSYHIVFPSIFVQSAVKPFADVGMMARYRDFFELTQQAGLLVVVGFGFNGDDGHINALVRQLLEAGTTVLVFDYQGRQLKAYEEKLRLETLSQEVRSRLKVVSISESRTSNDMNWLGLVGKMISGHE